jgi:hypothetical protein
MVLDIDGNGLIETLADGILISRYLNGLRGAELIAGAVGVGATRTTAAAIEGYIEDVYERLDADGNGEVHVNAEGLLILRYMFGFTGNTLINGVVEPGGKRQTATEIIDYLDSLTV